MAPLVIGPFGEKWSYLLSLPNHDLLLLFLCPSSSIMPPKDAPTSTGALKLKKADKAGNGTTKKTLKKVPTTPAQKKGTAMPASTCKKPSVPDSDDEDDEVEGRGSEVEEVAAGAEGEDDDRKVE